MTVRRINFAWIPVDDQDRAIGFYTRHLGFEVQVDAPYEDGWRWVFLVLPDGETKLHLATRADAPLNPDKPVLCLVCDSVDGLAEQLAANGVTITGGPDDAPWGAPTRWLTIRDSEDNIVLLESLKEG